MPRKKTTSTVTGTASSLKFGAILAFFATSSLEIADFALDLVTDAVKQRHAKGKAVIAGRAKTANEAMDAATASATRGSANGPRAVETATAATPRKKPGPPKGFRKGQKAGKGETQGTAGATSAVSQAADGNGTGEGNGDVTDVTALPPQEGVLDLDAPASDR